MKSSITPSLPSRSSFSRIGLAILSVVLSGGFAIAQPTPSETKPPEKTPMATQKPTASPKPSPTPDTKIDANTSRELVERERELAETIGRNDATRLGDILADGYLDSIEGADWAISKKGVLVRCAHGKLRSYFIQRERRLSRIDEAIIVEGLARRNHSAESEAELTEQWTRVRHVWIRKDQKWKLLAQVREQEEKERD
jgi:hypothetical protein